MSLMADGELRGPVLIRRRTPADLPPLGAALLAQQAETAYPFRNPLPVPLEVFLRAEDAQGAWTAELGGQPVGHVCRTGPAGDFADADLLNAVCARAHGCEVGELTWVGALFVAPEMRGRGIGGLLLERVIADAREAGLRPCLEVLPVHPAALGLYLATGWHEVHRLRPEWLREAAGETGPDVLVMVLLGR